MATSRDTQTHTTIAARQGGSVGVKDMLFDQVRRLAVRTPGTEGAEGIGSVYLTAEECREVAAALTEPSRYQLAPDDRAALAAEVREIATRLAYVSTAGAVDARAKNRCIDELFALAAKIAGEVPG